MTKKGESGSSSRKRLYELVEERRPRSRRGIDSLDDVLIMEERDLIQEHKRLRLEQLIERKRRENEKMREGGTAGGPLPSNTDFLNMSKAVANLSPEEAQIVRSAYTFFKLAEKQGSGAGMNLLLPLIGYARQNPGSSEGQMVQYLKLMDGQMAKGIQLAKAVNPGQSDDNTLKFMSLMKDLVIAGVRDPLIQAMKELQPQPGLLEQIFMKPEVFTRFKELGFGGSNTATTHLDLEIEKLRGERQLTTTKLELEMRRDELKRQAEDRRTDTLISVFAPLASAFAGSAVSGKMRDLGQQQAAAHNPIKTLLTPMTPPGDYVQLQCPCGYRGIEPLSNPPQTKIICPICKQVLTPEIPPKEEKTVGTSVIHSTEENIDERLV